MASLGHVGIIGAGAWGTALSLVAADAGLRVTLWAREADVAYGINHSHFNARYLPEVQLHPDIIATTDISAALSTDFSIVAVPTQFIRSTLTPYSDEMKGRVLVSVAKGLELGSHYRVSEILRDIEPDIGSYCILSGPSHAEEVGRRMPTSVVCASTDSIIAANIQACLSTESFRIYAARDVLGVELCGALKNVIAIAAGIVDGLRLGDNTKAALITRGLAEMARLGIATGAIESTFYGLAGLGDLIVTCDSRHSRNRYVGECIGRGQVLDDVLRAMNAVAEGVPTTKAAMELAAQHKVELPITQGVYSVLFDDAVPRNVLRSLMLRQLRFETF